VQHKSGGIFVASQHKFDFSLQTARPDRSGPSIRAANRTVGWANAAVMPEARTRKNQMKSMSIGGLAVQCGVM
jgi:hypothetical protein